MFVNTKEACKLAEHYARRKQEVIKRQAVHPDSPIDGTKSESSVRTASTWLMERNTKLRAQALQVTQESIAAQEKRKEAVMAQITRNIRVATARFEDGNERGMFLSMKKIVTCQAQIEQIREIVEALERLYMDVSAEDVKPERCEVSIEKALSLPLKVKRMTDSEMLKAYHKLDHNILLCGW